MTDSISNHNQSHQKYFDQALNLCSESGDFHIAVRGACMSPSITDGAKVKINPCGAKELKSGDIVLLRHSGQTVLHRFLGVRSRKTGDIVIVKADNHWRADPAYPCEAVIGKVTNITNMDNRKSFAIPPLARLKAQFWFSLHRLGLLHNSAAKIKQEALFLKTANGVWKITAKEGHSLQDEIQITFTCTNNPEKKLTGRLMVDCTKVPNNSLTKSLDTAEKIGDTLSFNSEKLSIYIDFKNGSASISSADIHCALSGIDSFLRLVAIRSVNESGGVCLHAASVSVDGKCLLFVGPSGTGKTTSAATFGDENILDDDFVALAYNGDSRVVRVEWRPAPNDSTTYPVTAILLPEKGDKFSLRRLSQTEAIGACMHLPPQTIGSKDAEHLIDSVAKLVNKVPVYRMQWKMGEDLPNLLMHGLKIKPCSATIIQVASRQA